MHQQNKDTEIVEYLSLLISSKWLQTLFALRTQLQRSVHLAAKSYPRPLCTQI